MSGLLVIGDAMLDRDIDGTVERICPEAPVPVLDETGRSSAPGGAARAAAIAAAAGRRVTLLTALCGISPNGPASGCSMWACAARRRRRSACAAMIER